jgi:hypothetical protein
MVVTGNESIGEIANMNALAAQRAIDWLREASRRAVVPQFRFDAGIALWMLERSPELAWARDTVAKEAAPWFDASAFERTIPGLETATCR